MELALEAILGQRSAGELEIDSSVVCSSANGARVGSDSWPKVCALLGHRACNCGTLHLPLVVYNHSCIVLKVDELPVLSSERLPLSDDYSRHHLFPQLWFSLLYGGQNHISAAPSGQSVQASTDPINCYHVQVLCTSVVSTVHDSPNRASQGDPELSSSGSSTSSLRHGGGVERPVPPSRWTASS